MKKWSLIAVVLGFAGMLAYLIAKPPAIYVPYTPPPAYSDAAARYLEENLVTMPAGWAWSFFTTPDGARLRMGRVEPTGVPRATLIYMPGFAAPLEVAARFLGGLQERGYRVIGIDARGQGRSTRMLDHNPEKPWISDFSHYAEDYAAFISSDMVPRDVPVIAMGESMGGHITMRMLGDFAPDIDGAFLIAPAFRINTSPLPRPVARAVFGALTFLGAGQKYAPGQSNWQPWQPDLAAENPCGTRLDTIHLKDTLYASNRVMRVGGATNKWLSEFIKSNDLLNRRTYLGNIVTPIAMVTSADDVIVSTHNSEKACNDKLANCHFKRLNAKHCLTYGSDEVIAQIYQQIDDLYQRITVRQPQDTRPGSGGREEVSPGQ